MTLSDKNTPDRIQTHIQTLRSLLRALLIDSAELLHQSHKSFSQAHIDQVFLGPVERLSVRVGTLLEQVDDELDSVESYLLSEVDRVVDVSRRTTPSEGMSPASNTTSAFASPDMPPISIDTTPQRHLSNGVAHTTDAITGDHQNGDATNAADMLDFLTFD